MAQEQPKTYIPLDQIARAIVSMSIDKKWMERDTIDRINRTCDTYLMSRKQKKSHNKAEGRTWKTYSLTAYKPISSRDQEIFVVNSADYPEYSDNKAYLSLDGN